MSTVEDLELSRLEDAALWLGRLESGHADRNAFEQWRTDPANAIAFVKVSATSNWFDSNSSAFSEVPRSTPKLGITRRWWQGAAAASIVLAAAGTGAYSLLNVPAFAQTGVGERTSLSLPDGGRLDVNTDSKASWKFTAKTRTVWLARGELSIEVNVDPRPFIVRASSEALRLGPGRYNIRLKGSRVEIAVIDGLGIILTPAGVETQTVPAGHVVSVSSGRPANVQTTDANAIEAISAWRNDELVLDGVTLSSAVSEYNRYLKAKIVLDDTANASLRLGGRFTTKDPAEFVKALEASFGIKARKGADGTIHLST